MKGLGNAIDNDDSRSSTWLCIKDFQQHGLRGRNWFGWFRDHGFAGVSFR
jgi:hypothetical protein